MKKNTLRSFSNLSESDKLKLVQELQAHQIELEMQTEELRLAKERSDKNFEIAMQWENTSWWTIEMSTGKVTFEKRKAEMLGYPPEKFKHYNDFVELVHPEDYDRTMNAMRGHINGLFDKYEVEYRILTKTGEYLWCHDIGGVVEKDTKGNPVLITGLVVNISERKKSELFILQQKNELAIANTNLLLVKNTLYETNEYLESLINYASIPIIVWNNRLHITRYNHAFELLTGWIGEELIGQSIEILFPPAFVAANRVLLSKTKSDERLTSVEIEILHSDKSTRTVLWNFAAIFEQDGHTPLATVAQGQDITDRKLKEQQLLESEHNLRERVKELNGLFSLGLLIEKFEKMEDIYIEFVNVIVPESMQFPDNVFASLEIENKRYCNIENFKLPENQKYLSAPITLSGIHTGELIVAYTEELPFIDFFEQNIITQFALRISKTAALKKSQFTLNEANQFSSQIINSAQEGVIVYDRNLKIQVWNPFMEKFSGFPASEVIGKYPLDVFPFLKEAGLIEILEKALNGETGNEVCFPFSIPQTEKTGWASDSAAPLLNSKNEIIGVISTVRDITERKQFEIKLIKAKEKAEESDRLKSAFLTNMSHEIHTPMNGILGFTELLKKPNLSSKDQQDFIQIIKISGDRMLNTINSIVDMAKIESGLMSLDIQETNINENIEFMYKFFNPEIKSKGLQLFFTNGLPAKDAIIRTDNEKVYGVFTNLIKNAIKFTNDGSIEFGYEKKGEYLEFFVKDTGIGIPENQKELIFERFRQVRDSNSRSYEGSGLGLSICKSYIEMLGGRIWVESEEGRGSIFYFTLPYNPISKEKSETNDNISTHYKEVKLNSLKILIAEDDEISYLLLSQTLQEISTEILHAMTGVQAIEACRNNPDIDLVLMDIRMPEMDGLEATYQIRQFNKDVIIIAQTANVFAIDGDKAIAAGCNDYITKPINETHMYESIKKYFGH